MPEIIDSAHLMRGKGIVADGLSINWAELMAHKHGFTDPVRQAMADDLAGNGVTTLHGPARFTGANHIEIVKCPTKRRTFSLPPGRTPDPWTSLAMSTWSTAPAS